MCLRVGILVNGQFAAIGSCEHLKAQHGRNFVMSIKVIPGFQLENMEKIKRIIGETFPAITFKDSHLVSARDAIYHHVIINTSIYYNLL